MRNVHCGGKQRGFQEAGLSLYLQVCVPLLAGTGPLWPAGSVCAPGAGAVAAQGVSARTAPACAAAASADLKAPAWSCFPAGAGVGSRAEACVNFLIKAAYRERNALLRFAFSVVSGSKSSLAVKSSAVDPANGRISHSLGVWLLLSSVTVLTV